VKSGKNRDRKRNTLQSGSGGVVEGKGEAEERDHGGGRVARLREENWPTLSAALEHDTQYDQSDVSAATLRTQNGRKIKRIGGIESTSPPPVTPPPGYAKITRPAKQPSSTATKLSDESVGVVAVSSNAFRPLPSETVADAPVTAASAKSSGGSKVFEDIRKALDYDKEKFKDFQGLSGWYRGGEISLTSYNAQCQKLFGLQWTSVGPLVAKAMPQGDKKEELLALFATSGSTGKVNKKTKKSGKTKKVVSVPNAWIGVGGVGDIMVGPSHLDDQRRRVDRKRGDQRRMPRHLVSEEEYPSLSVASKLPQPPRSQSAWNVQVHT
jgi:hypothetical protein